MTFPMGSPTLAGPSTSQLAVRLVRLGHAFRRHGIAAPSTSPGFRPIGGVGQVLILAGWLVQLAHEVGDRPWTDVPAMTGGVALPPMAALLESPGRSADKA